MGGDLVAHVLCLVRMVPSELLLHIAARLEQAGSWEQVSPLVIPMLHSPSTRDQMTRFFHLATDQQRTPSEVALALQTACQLESVHRSAPMLELVLSGPVFPPFDVRRTDEALLQMIQMASGRLTLMSFALYRLDRLTHALVAAVQRQVCVRLLVDSRALERRNLVDLYGSFLRQHMEFFVWSPPTQEIETEGVFHAKAAIADDRWLLISSANLTESAMTANVELGIFIEGGHLPNRVESLFNDYLKRGLFVRV